MSIIIGNMIKQVKQCFINSVCFAKLNVLFDQLSTAYRPCIHKISKQTKISSTHIDLWDVIRVVMSVTYGWMDANSRGGPKGCVWVMYENDNGNFGKVCGRWMKMAVGFNHVLPFNRSKATKWKRVYPLNISKYIHWIVALYFLMVILVSLMAESNGVTCQIKVGGGGGGGGGGFKMGYGRISYIAQGPWCVGSGITSLN